MSGVVGGEAETWERERGEPLARKKEISYHDYIVAKKVLAILYFEVKLL